MFTGLIQAIGSLHLVDAEQVQIFCPDHAHGLILGDLAIGDSVAVDGVCLTVTSIQPSGFMAAVSPETLRRTTLGQRPTGPKRVNLETSLRVGSKLGGHFVTGHIDGIGYLQSALPTATSWEMTFTTTDDQIARYILPKGSIAINGISLTIASCDAEGTQFMVAVIPHTYAETNLSDLQTGSWVNLEADILGKYVEKLLRRHEPNAISQSALHPGDPLSEAITPAFLTEHGYS
jgi:riboflavin synthase